MDRNYTPMSYMDVITNPGSNLDAGLTLTRLGHFKKKCNFIS